MDGIPEQIRKTFEGIRESNDFYTVLRRISGRYYVYRQSSRLDKEKGKIVTVSKYLGRIADDGTYVRKVDTASVPIPRTYDGGEPSAFDAPALTKEDATILTYLSMDAKFSVSALARQLGLTPPTLYGRIRRLEQTYGVRYTIELDLDKLGYSKFMVFAKFLDRKPALSEMKAATERLPNVQLAAMLEGGFDALVYIIAENNREISRIVYEMERSLAKYPSRWYISYFHETYGFVPLRDAFFDVLKGKLKRREHDVLREMNADGSVEFAEIDKEYGQVPGRAAYSYYCLRERDVLKRITVCLKNVPARYIGILYASFIEREKLDAHRREFLMNIIKDTDSPATRYLLTGDVGVPHGGLYFLPVFRDGDLERAKESLEKTSPGTHIDTDMISNVLVGSFCYRKFDNTYSTQYERLVGMYKMPPKERTYRGKPRKRPSEIDNIPVLLEKDDED